MLSLTDWLAHSSGAALYAVVAALVFCEDALFFGFVLPGETAVVLGGVVAGQGRVSVYWLAAVVVAAAIAGDSVGYEVGRRFGPRILGTRALRGHHERIGKARAFIRRRGPAAVFLGRFVAFFRALMPALAGISRMPYPTFLLFNALGGLVWGVGFTLLGYFAGTAYEQVEKTAGTAVAVTVAALVAVAIAVWQIRKRRGERAEQGGDAERADPEQRDARNGGAEHAGTEHAGTERGDAETSGTGNADAGPTDAGPTDAGPTGTGSTRRGERRTGRDGRD